MPSVLLGNSAYGKNNFILIKWIWTRRNYKYVKGMPLGFHGWQPKNWAVYLARTLEALPVELLQESVALVGCEFLSQGRCYVYPVWTASHLAKRAAGVPTAACLVQGLPPKRGS